MMTKKCSKCQKVKETTEFSKNKCKKDGFNQECKPCNRESHKKAREKGLTRWHDMKKTLGIGEKEYNALLEEQEYVCAICSHPHVEEKGGRLHVDHDHETGKIRGLLCNHCNLGLGHFKDNPTFLSSAIWYLDYNDEDMI